MYFTFSTYVAIVAFALLVAGLVLLAGTDRNTRAEWRNSVGCLLVALAFLLHGVFVSGAALPSPRKVVHGDLGVADFRWTGTTQLYLGTPHLVPGSDALPLPCGFDTDEVGVLFRDTASGDFTRAVMSGKV